MRVSVASVCLSLTVCVHVCVCVCASQQDQRAMRNDLPFDLHFYDELANQQAPIVLTVRTKHHIAHHIHTPMHPIKKARGARRLQGVLHMCSIRHTLYSAL